MPPLTMSVRAIAPNTRRFSATRSGVPPEFEISSIRSFNSFGIPLLVERINRAIASVEIHARHSGLSGERNKVRVVRRKVAAAYVVALLRKHDDRAALRSFIGKRT